MKTSQRESRRKKLHLLDEHLIGIGHVAVRAGQLEMTIKMAVDRRSNYGPLPKSLKKIVMDLGQRKQMALLEEWLSRDLPRRHAPAIQDLFRRIHAALNHRNDLIHSAWQKTEVDAVKNLIDVGLGEIKTRRTGITAKTLNDLADEMLDLGVELTELELEAMSARLERRATSLGISLPPSAPPNSGATSDSGTQKKQRRRRPRVSHLKRDARMSTE